MSMEGMHASIGDTFRGREYAERMIINVEWYSEVVQPHQGLWVYHA